MAFQPRDQMLAASVWKWLKASVGVADRAETLVMLRELREPDQPVRELSKAKVITFPERRAE